MTDVLVLSMAEVDEIAALAEKATLGKWHAYILTSRWGYSRVEQERTDPRYCVICDARDDDAAFIAAARSAVPDLVATVRAYREELQGLVWQFGHRTVFDGRLAITPGGLSALESAFEALGWDEQHFVGDEHACEIDGCQRWPVMGSKWDGLYMALCSEHGSMMTNGSAIPPVRQAAIDRAATRRAQEDTP